MCVTMDIHQHMSLLKYRGKNKQTNKKTNKQTNKQKKTQIKRDCSDIICKVQNCRPADLHQQMEFFSQAIYAHEWCDSTVRWLTLLKPTCANPLTTCEPQKRKPTSVKCGGSCGPGNSLPPTLPGFLPVPLCIDTCAVRCSQTGLGWEDPYELAWYLEELDTVKLLSKVLRTVSS